jgi:hypothetical protein
MQPVPPSVRSRLSASSSFSRYIHKSRLRRLFFSQTGNSPPIAASLLPVAEWVRHIEQGPTDYIGRLPREEDSFHQRNLLLRAQPHPHGHVDRPANNTKMGLSAPFPLRMMPLHEVVGLQQMNQTAQSQAVALDDRSGSLAVVGANPSQTLSSDLAILTAFALEVVQ